ncbi:hypothetical protein [Micromonospora sp. NPDC005171]|uniref:hypothetical protein n=1 Tax=Micromonospora sp. NPDC005171 TaxID=3156866 RepID=UPI0033A284E2
MSRTSTTETARSAQWGAEGCSWQPEAGPVQAGRALIISRGDPSVFLTRLISAALLALAAAALVVAVLPTIRQRRAVVFAEEE